MPNQRGWSLHLTCHLGHIRHIFTQCCPAQPFSPLTAAMTTQAQSVGYITVSGEISQEVLCPAPRGMGHTMHEQDWRGTRIMCRFFLDGLQPHTNPYLQFHPRRAKGLRSSFVLDPEGRIRYSARGMVAWDDPKVASQIAALIPRALRRRQTARRKAKKSPNPRLQAQTEVCREGYQLVAGSLARKRPFPARS